MASSSWMTTFYYQQDLRSLYMNGILSAGFKPGIYNADMALYTVNADVNATETNGLYLYIKKGTTLVFSNSTVSDSEGYHRDLSVIGSYLIKCVATTDMRVQIAEIQTASERNNALFGNSSSSVSAESKLFLTALMTYDSEDNNGLESPVFCIAKINENRSTGESYYTLLNMDYKLPDGTSVDLNPNLSYLFLGAINTPVTNKYYSNGTDWLSSSSAEEWMLNHVFTARGLPDYRQTMIADDPSNTPDVIMSPDFKSLFVDTGDFINENIIYNRDFSWEKVYGIGTSQALSSDFEATNIDSYSGKSGDEQLEEVSGSNKLLLDMVFLSTRTKYSNFLNEKVTSLADMFDASSTQDKYKEDAAIHQIRIASINSFGDDSLTPSSMRTSYSLDGAGSIVPLDLSKTNLERLMKFVRNRNVLPALISYMRYNGYLDPEDTTCIIPLALIFRGETANSSTGDLEPSDDISSWGAVNRIHPANILSLMDLQYKSTKLESMSIKDSNTYSVIPIIG